MIAIMRRWPRSSSALVCMLFIKVPALLALIAGAGRQLPAVRWLKHKRTARMKRFEEQFPEALDLLSRAIRAGHAFQTAMGMVADELPAPVGIEFKKAFEQQNFGLPLREVLDQMAERVPLLDVKFFVTAVTIQRETGGNLAEILDNLAHVVRERFKILRQVRVHTAHGRFTGYVLLALPAALAVALMFINPEHMKLLFEERMGQMMIARRHRDAGDRLRLDPQGHQDRGVAWSLLLPDSRVPVRLAAGWRGAAMALAPARGGVIQRRLGELRGIPGMAVDEPSPYGESVKRSLTRLGKYAPTSAAEMGKLKGRLVCAGYRGGRSAAGVHRLAASVAGCSRSA